jgi:hypothetical protein
MPKRNYKGLIPEIYQKNFETIGMFFWVEGQKHIVPTITIKEAIEKYLRFIDMELDIECAITTYGRIKKEFLKNG